MKVYAHYSEFDPKDWTWPNFTPEEIASNREGELVVSVASMDKLQALRTALGKPMKITSAYRSEKHNEAVGSTPESMHREARAFDVPMQGHDPAEFELAARQAGFTGFGYYPRGKGYFIHIDTGRERFWGDKWFDSLPISDVVEMAPPPPKPSTQKKSKRNWAGAAGGVATVATGFAGGVEGWVIVALVLIGVVTVAALVYTKHLDLKKFGLS